MNWFAKDVERKETNVESWNRLLEDVVPLVDNVRYILNAEHKAKVIQFLNKLKNEVRLHFLPYGENVRTIWELIEQDPVVRDYVLTSYIQLTSKSMAFEETDKEVTNLLIHRTVLLNNSRSVMSREVRDILPDVDTARLLFDRNPWLLFIYAVILSTETDSIIHGLLAAISTGGTT